LEITGKYTKKNLHLLSMNAIHRQHLDMPVYSPSYFQELSTMLIFFQVFSLHLTSGELEGLF